MKAAIRSLMGQTACPPRHFKPYAVAAADRLNHIRRECLDEQTACQVFESRKNEIRLDRRERRKVYELLIKTKETILQSTGDRGQRA
jgi:hypothetical protein